MALLLVDVVNDLEFEGGAELLPHALAMAGALAQLKARARRAGVPCIYVNDNFGRWRSDFQAIVGRCSGRGMRGRPIVRALMPSARDFFVLKPKHSGFHSTVLDALLTHLGVRHLVLTGMATEHCVLLTAGDAFMRDYRVTVVSDCVASETTVLRRNALDHMRRCFKARVLEAKDLRWPRERRA